MTLAPLRWLRTPVAFHKAPQSDAYRRSGKNGHRKISGGFSRRESSLRPIFKPTSTLVDLADREPVVHGVIAGSDGLFDVFKEHPTHSE
jgi:hypothetical protein